MADDQPSTAPVEESTVRVDHTSDVDMTSPCDPQTTVPDSTSEAPPAPATISDAAPSRLIDVISTVTMY